MTHASLFSGIGGFDLASEWMGWTNLFNCEIEEFPRKVLKYHFPKAIQYADIKETDFTKHAGQVDVLTGGFPCQPYSTAGKRLGKEDERHLWPEMLRAIREIKPRWIVGENVRGLLSWNDGLVFDEVQTDLEVEGYEVQSFILPAAGINAPHRRDRVWIVAKNTMCSRFIQRESIQEGAEVRKQRNTSPRNTDRLYRKEGIDVANTNNNGYINTLGRGDGKKEEIQGEHRQKNDTTWKSSRTDSKYASNPSSLGGSCNSSHRCEEEGGEILSSQQEGGGVECSNLRHSSIKYASDTISERSQRISTKQELEGGRLRESYQQGKYWENFPTQPPICGGDDGISRELDSITFPKWRKESIKGYGNAIVPQIAYRIFQSIQLTEDYND